MDAESIPRLRFQHPYGDPESIPTIGEMYGPSHVGSKRQYQPKYTWAFERIEGGGLFMPASLADQSTRPHHSSGRSAPVRFLTAGAAWEMVDKSYIESLNTDGKTVVHDAIDGEDICTACEDADFGGSSSWRNKRPRSLGKAVDLLSCWHCSFCRLVTQFLKNQQGESTEELLRIADGFNVLMTSVPAAYPLSFVPPGCRPYEILVHFVHQEHPMKTALAARIREQADGIATLFRGRIIRPLLDVQLARRWLDDCVQHHTGCSGSGHAPADAGGDAALEPELLVIDVKQACLVSKPAGARYVALSYVWPRPKEGALQGDTLLLVKANRDIPGRPGSLLHGAEAARLPNVIKEAMQVVRDLEESYLWIDALCIVQDDADMKADLIGKMDLVYGNAHLTVVVATLQSPEEDYQIPGVGRKRDMQVAETVDGREMLVAIPGYNVVLSHTYWATRGWTFQEGILSRRCLYLTDLQAYFRCVRDVRCEDVVAEAAEADFAVVRRHPAMAEQADQNFEYLLSPRFIERVSHKNSFSEYCGVARNYSQRQLTVPSDVLHAFSGVLKWLLPHFGVRDGFVAGLPASSFDRALMWYSTAPIIRRSPWPTWSWAGWIGPVDYESEILPRDNYMLDLPHCIWYRLGNDGKELVPVRNYFPYLLQPCFSLGLLWAKLPIIEAGFGSRIVTWASIIRRRFAPASQERHIANWVSDAAQSVPFLSILDGQGDACGFIASTDRFWLWDHQLAESDGLCDLLLLSLAAPTSADSLSGREGIFHEKYSVPCYSKTSFTNVLLIKLGNGDEPATRHGAGKMHNAAFDADDIADVDRRLIVLG